MTDTPEQSGVPLALAPALTLADMSFLVFLAAILMAVVWLGRIAYLEGVKTEVTKASGEAWVQWFTEASPKRFTPGFEPSSCAGGASPAGTNGKSAGSDAGASVNPVPERLWEGCLESLMKDVEPIAGLRNPFSGKPLMFAAKCDTDDRSLVGAMVLEKLTPTPPGSAVAYTTSSLVGADIIERKLQLRVTVCDKGAYPIRIAEVEF